MTNHKTGTREELVAASKQVTERRDELAKQADELAKQRRELPWVAIKKEYTLETDDGPKTLKDLFDGRSQLLVYHLMFGPSWSAACPACSTLVDHYDAMVPHLNGRDVTLICVSHAPLEKLRAYRRRMGWRLPWASSFHSDFNNDFGASFTAEDSKKIAAEVLPQFEGEQWIVDAAASCGVDLRGYVTTEAPGLDAFVLEPDGAIYHTFTSVPTGDLNIGYQELLDRTPRGGKEGVSIVRHDEYPTAAASRSNR